MGSRHPDRVSAAVWRQSCETLGDMYRKRWALAVVCRTCRLELRADLVSMVLRLKPDFSPWNRTSRCRRIGCRGVVDFRFRAPGMSYFMPLTSGPPAAAPQGHVIRAFEEERDRQRKRPPGFPGGL